ncbi:uncharacterized protein LOC126674900 [Mercurialis annua]|uniref:uncharacterized protein LOC126674900 n=1 Tax=Mercurialis annua TaxID=3986 RepID=UPI0024AFAD2C|nr:uncharacterized protein LOC126674900 [Mercurialis annua]
MCLTLMFAVKKLRHYLQAHQIQLISKAGLIKYVMSKPVLSGRLAKWALLLQKFDISYVSQKAVKGQALADFLADPPIPDNWEFSNDFPDEDVFLIQSSPWKMYFDGAACQNAEYQALILDLDVAIVMNIDHINVFGYSKLVVNQLLSIYEVKKPELIPYFQHANRQIERFDIINIEHVPRKENKQADALANLAATLTLSNTEVQVIVYDEEAIKALEEAHSEVCGAHQSGPKLHFHIKRMGYYWPIMVKDYMEYAKKCQGCQFYENIIRQPHEPLHPTVAFWSFDAWGLDVVSPLPKIYGGTPRYIITDNGKEFSNKAMDTLCVEFKFEQYNSFVYNAPANGLAKAFNKTLCSLLKKNVSRTKRDWHERPGEALCAYRITHRTATGATPYSLVYGTKAVVPLECQVPSLRIAIQEGLSSDENARLRLKELEALDEKGLEAQQRLECYQARMSKAFNKKREQPVVRLLLHNLEDVAGREPAADLVFYKNLMWFGPLLDLLESLCLNGWISFLKGRIGNFGLFLNRILYCATLCVPLLVRKLRVKEVNCRKGCQSGDLLNDGKMRGNNYLGFLGPLLILQFWDIKNLARSSYFNCMSIYG